MQTNEDIIRSTPGKLLVSLAVSVILALIMGPFGRYFDATLGGPGFFIIILVAGVGLGLITGLLFESAVGFLATTIAAVFGSLGALGMIQDREAGRFVPTAIWIVSAIGFTSIGVMVGLGIRRLKPHRKADV